MSRTAAYRRHGTAGLLVALFAAAGLVFSYGLGHGPPQRVCTEHAVSALVGAAPAATGHGPAAPDAPPPGLHGSPGLHGLAAAAPAAPADQPPLTPLDACLCAAVLFSLLVLALVTGLRRPLSRLPARTGWSLPPPGGAFVPVFPPAPRVLRL